MNKKIIKKQRNMSYFIDAASKIIDEEGIEFVTIRKVADLAGYNSATLYNYFEDLDELIFYSSIRHLKEYTLALKNYIKDVNNNLDTYYKVWECFCSYSFSNPQVYNIIFFSKHSNSFENVIEEYYSIFPEELGEQSEDLLPMLLKSNIYDRNLSLLMNLVTDGYLRQEDLNTINEMTLLLYQAMLTRVLNRQVDYTLEQATDVTVQYVKNIVNFYIK